MANATIKVDIIKDGEVIGKANGDLVINEGQNLPVAGDNHPISNDLNRRITLSNDATYELELEPIEVESLDKAKEMFTEGWTVVEI